MYRRKRTSDTFRKSATYLSALLSSVVLIAIIVFVIINGSGLLSIKLLVSDYHPKNYSLEDKTNKLDRSLSPFEKPSNLNENEYFSYDYGITLKDSKDSEGKNVVVISRLDKRSPLYRMDDKSDPQNTVQLKTGFEINTIIFDNGSVTSRNGAEMMVLRLEEANYIETMSLSSGGGGIRGSLLTTFVLIILTLAIALPFGILTAIYLNEIASKNKFNDILRSLIDMLTGIPSIIYGLMGAALFVPFSMNVFKTQGGSLISGSLTLAIIVLPVIIKATEEALIVVPRPYKEASYALGANMTQTTFKVVLPNALPGILSATLLSIGRIIGESAALIYAIGTAIKDDISIFDKGTSLAVHMWSVMAGEVPNVEMASSIAIILLVLVLILNISVKLVSRKFLKKYEGAL